MTAAKTHPPCEVPPTAPVAAGRRPFRYTLERYHAAIEAGIFTENDSMELIFGEIIEKMTIGKRHLDCVNQLNLLFVRRFGDRYVCSAQNPITLLENSEPEPDYAIIDRQTYAQRSSKPLAEDVLLVVEVADATLGYDRTVKAKLYALAGIPEYWIINLPQNQLELHLDPVTDTGDYNHVRRYPNGQPFVSPFAGEMTVADLLPG